LLASCLSDDGRPGFGRESAEMGLWSTSTRIAAWLSHLSQLRSLRRPIV